jgi:hypothetical protein
MKEHFVSTKPIIDLLVNQYATNIADGVLDYLNKQTLHKSSWDQLDIDIQDYIMNEVYKIVAAELDNFVSNEILIDTLLKDYQ